MEETDGNGHKKMELDEASKVKCKFQAVYNDLQKNETFELWSCDENIKDRDSLFCIFHTNIRSEEEDKQAFELFEAKIEKIKNSNDPNKRLFCIGYRFPNNMSFNRRSKDEQTLTYDFPIYLCDAEFEGVVEFSYCTFKKSLNLSGATFRKEVLFRFNEFEGSFYPRNTKFFGNVNFRGTKFKKTDFDDDIYSADFHDTLFSDKANFHGAKFCGKTRFLDARFVGKANFKKSYFDGKIEFYGTTFNQAEFSPVEIKDIVKFRKVVFENGEKVNFDVTNMGKVSFLDTDISRVKFAENINWGGKKGFTVHDEQELELKLKNTKSGVKNDPDLESIKAIYRNLRENCEYRLRYDDAGQFFIREMELKRNYSLNDDGKIVITDQFRRNFSLTGFYRLASYGEKFRMPILLSVSVIVGAILVTLLKISSAGIIELDHNGSLAIQNNTERIVTTFLQLRNEQLIWSDTIVKVLGVLSLGLFAIPLRRKFERKFRH